MILQIHQSPYKLSLDMIEQLYRLRIQVYFQMKNREGLFNIYKQLLSKDHELLILVTNALAALQRKTPFITLEEKTTTSAAPTFFNKKSKPKIQSKKKKSQKE